MSVLSGGLVYEYSQESDEYGLVAINSSTEVTLTQDCMYKLIYAFSVASPMIREHPSNCRLCMFANKPQTNTSRSSTSRSTCPL